MIDEPDAHLHPDRQAKLIKVLEKVADVYDLQILLTTHSPHVIRAASENVKIAWFANGTVVNDDERIRQKMGWGLLDKSTLIITEDTNTELLAQLLNQWPKIAKTVQIWSVHGVDNLPSPTGVQDLLKITGVDRVILHADRDFRTAIEKKKVEEKYLKEGVPIWITTPPDIEGYFCDPSFLATKFGKESSEIKVIIGTVKENVEKVEVDFTNKRTQINKKDFYYKGGGGTPSNDDVKAELEQASVCGWIKGKSILGPLKQELRKIDSKVDIESIESDYRLAEDLRSLIESPNARVDNEN